MTFDGYYSFGQPMLFGLPIPFGQPIRFRQRKERSVAIEGMDAFVDAGGLLLMVGLHTLFAAVATRFFRLRLETSWGALVYIAFAIPVVLFASMLFLSGALGLGPDLGSREAVFVVVIALPVILGYTIDVFWMPHPDDVELPDTVE